ncbi:MAG: ABC transporter ATP-binding protein [Bacillota bacterium]|jgi:ATP-binding cassette subfamily B multidrug efflux pump
MIKLLKFLKKSVVLIICIVLLLIGQAFCDLALPSYISDIVNVGLQQDGIKNAVPEVISKKSMDQLKLLMKNDEQKQIDETYILLDEKSASSNNMTQYAQKYPQSTTQPLYILAENLSQNTQDQLNLIFGRAIIMFSILNDDSEISQKLQQEISAELQIPAGTDLLTVINNLPVTERQKMISQADAKFSEIPEIMITQSAVTYLKAEKQSLGIDLDQERLNYVLITGLKMLILAVLSICATFLVVLLAARIGARLGQDLRSGIFRKVIGFSNKEMDEFSTASLITRSTNDIQQIQTTMVMVLRLAFYAPIIGIGAFIKATSQTPSMGWIIGLAVLALLTLVILMFIVLIPKFKVMQKLIDKLNMAAREILTGLMVIRSFGTQKHEEERFDKANTDLTKVNLFVNRGMSIMMPIIFLIMNATTVLIVWQGGLGVDAGEIQVGDMMAFIQYTMMIIISFLMVSMVAIMFPRAAVAANRVDEVLQTSSSIPDPLDPQKFDDSKRGFVEFHNVSFRYPNAEENVLSNITFTARPGETTAFIGGTGSGKSTLINLIPRFFDVTEGEILVNGVDIRNVLQHDLREKIGYIPQESVLFSGNIASNIKYADENISDAAMQAAARIAQATDFISEKEQGYQTEITQGGTNVSGGQKQRLSIARAIAKNPEIYIFDDSFSALDYKTDFTLRKALKTELANSTVLIVAQRISTILHAEQIIVLDEGKIIGQGTHKELLETCPAYKQLASTQLSEVELS